MLSFKKVELQTILSLLNNGSVSVEDTSSLKDKVEYMIKDIEQKEEKEEKAKLLCSSCHGDGEYEVSAGSHSFFRDCECCGGTGKAK